MGLNGDGVCPDEERAVNVEHPERRPSALTRDTFANLLGGGWAAVLGFVCYPVYIWYIGIESYGVIGFFIVLQNLVMRMDLGLSSTLNRELAQSRANPDASREAPSLVRTLEAIYWVLGGVLAAGMAFGAPLLARYWVKPEDLSVEAVTNAFYLMSLILFLQWPRGLYMGGLCGLQRQVLLNVLMGSTATVRVVGAVLILHFVSPNLHSFLLWEIVISAVEVGTLRLFVIRGLPTDRHPARFKVALLRKIWRFAAGLTANSVLSFLPRQLDKIVLSKMLSLEDFGYYSLAVLAVRALQLVVVPVYRAVFPEFSRLVKRGVESELKAAYHQAAQTLAVLLLPVGITMAVLSWQFMFLWTGSAETADRTQVLVSLLAIGGVLNGLATVPYALQLAYGWTGLAVRCSAIAVVVLPPITVVMVLHYGAIGAAVPQVLLNLCYLLIAVPVMHTRLLSTEMRGFFAHGVLLPLVPVVVVTYAWRILHPVDLSRATQAVWLFCAGAMALAAAAASVPVARTWLRARLGRAPTCSPPGGELPVDDVTMKGMEP